MMSHQRIRGSDLKQKWRNSHYITSIKWALKSQQNFLEKIEKLRNCYFPWACAVETLIW